MKLLDVGFMVAAEIKAKIKGRAADQGASLPWLAMAAIAAGHGDHVEIGSLFGASAIVVALAKKWCNLEGKVYCIDPYYPRSVEVHPGANGEMFTEEEINGTPEQLMENAQLFGVELELIQKPSLPFPEELADKQFASAYIDGDHTGETPWNDFCSLKDRVFGTISIDNYEEGYPPIMSAVHRALAETAWRLYFKNDIFVSLRPSMPPRGLDNIFMMLNSGKL